MDGILRPENNVESSALTGPHRHNWLNADEQGVDTRRHVAFRSRADLLRVGARVPRGTSKPLVTTSLVSEREEAVRPQIEFSAVDLSPEKDLQHRLEVLALATDREERCLMEARPFQRLQAQRRVRQR
ncbi:hypothetical protein THAOC_09655 [Thalassiosira oceanica]|uniref:Uncharacterized protein n=1 Tax=Thalassiosira oceanica TaxID=159749 RepID=K0TF30_THAOC|nr:hypothetical protein THAOC_09655 [Thalassiosira oceanica]|eukprot:EJK69122.1 hypothetical protein THAOC_09655 [Thalassiosira oceanica]